MKKFLLFLFLIVIHALLPALQVSPQQAFATAQSFLGKTGYVGAVSFSKELRSDKLLAYVYQLQPAGYIVVSAETDLPPVLAYSTNCSFAGEEGNLLEELLSEDISLRLKEMTADLRERNHQKWLSVSAPRDSFQQWPPEGSTLTGGWLKTQWTQSAPYNNMCPIDPVTGIRSQAGCPAVAMAQIVNYYQTINLTSFNDFDDYYHNYQGRSFWIDNDYAAHGFPAWPELNGYLDTLMQHYKYQQPQTNEDMAALVYACGVAAEQVYTSAGSGTFGVNQALDAYQRFNFQDMELLTDTTPDLYNRMAQNIMDAQPVHLAVVTPAWDSGHNVVVDGYNTDGYYHLNFGWGGAYSGWYLLPSEMPFNLTVVEGAIVDIHPRQYFMAIPEVVDFTDPQTVCEPHALELVNISDVPLSIEAVQVTPINVYNSLLEVQHSDLPLVLAAGQSFVITLQWLIPVYQLRELIQGSVSVTHSAGVFSVPMLLDGTYLNSDANDAIQQAPNRVTAYPNPFSERLTLKSNIEDDFSVKVFNLRGQCVDRLSGRGELNWDAGKDFGSGLYLLRIEQSGRSYWKRVLKIK